ncbi:MAG: hypothetical protein M4579_005658 [Chaenotheca gracillima]|nr:MAG: hypothetical protein M4579_005658 [Chaenotheca gracillima]
MVSFWQVVSALAITATVVQAVPTCLTTQERAPGAPYISSVITDSLDGMLSNTKGAICYGGFPTLPNGSKNKKVRRSNGSLVLQATRHVSKPHLGQECVAAFKSIISTCIGQALYWGGNVTVNGIEYTVFNEAYPKNWVPPSSRVSTPVSKPTKPAKVPPKAPVVPSKKTTSSPTTSRNSSHVTKSPLATSPAPFKTSTLYGVTGKPGSFSQTTTTDKNGLATVLPIWFGGAGVALLVVPAGAALGAHPPPPPGLPPVHIGPDGHASAGPDADDSHPTHHASSPHSDQHASATSHASSSRASSSSSRSSSSSSATPTATGTSHIILPKDAHASANDALTTELKSKFGSLLLTVSNSENGVLMWSAPLTEDQVNQYTKNAAVSSIERDNSVELKEDSLGPETSGNNGRSLAFEDRTDEDEVDDNDVDDDDDDDDDDEDEWGTISKRANLKTQEAAPWELVAASYPPGVTKRTNDYVYDNEAGLHSTIYFMDSGANPVNPIQDFSRMPGRQRWIYAPGVPGDKLKGRSTSDPQGHGSCVLSKAMGAKYGIAKRADAVIIRFSQRENGQASLSAAVLMAMLNEVITDVVDQGTTKNVLVVSFYLDEMQLTAGNRRIYAELFRTLLRHGVVVSVAAGNFGKTSKEITTFPPVLASEMPLMVVGSVDEYGVTHGTSQGGPLLTISAGGVRVLCASHSGRGSRFGTGTSYAAPLAGGMAAYLMSLPKHHDELFGGGISQVPARMNKLMRSLAYKRGAGTEPVIFNGENWIEDDSCEAVAESSSTSSSEAHVPTFRPTTDPNPDFPGFPTVKPPAVKKREACSAKSSFSTKTTKAPSTTDPEAALLSAVAAEGSRLSTACKGPCRSILAGWPENFRTTTTKPPAVKSTPPPPPPKSAPPADPCVTCEGDCVKYAGGCAAACLLPLNGAADQCGACIEAASGPQSCIDCYPKCRRSKLNGGIDCTSKEIFKTCTGVNGNPGLCTWLPFGRQQDYGKSGCTLGQSCDLAVAGTETCVP